jgi:DNA-binding transcriptional LysR family regulator
VAHQIAFEANDLALLRSLVARGIGLAIVPCSFLERPGPEIAFRPLTPALQVPVVLWWRGGRRLSPAAQAFIEFVDGQRP